MLQKPDVPAGQTVSFSAILTEKESVSFLRAFENLKARSSTVISYEQAKGGMLVTLSNSTPSGTHLVESFKDGFLHLNGAWDRKFSRVS